MLDYDDVSDVCEAIDEFKIVENYGDYGRKNDRCDLKVRENKNQISVIAHNLFGFDFFFFLKGLRLGSWRTRNISIEGTNLVNINFANIANQVN